MSEQAQNAELAPHCATTYYGEFLDITGRWCRFPHEHESSTAARDEVRKWLADAGYNRTQVRVVKVHTHTTIEVIDQSAYRIPPAKD